MPQPDDFQCLPGTLSGLVPTSTPHAAVALVDQRELDVLERRRAGQEVEGLEDEAALAIVDVRKCVIVESADVDTVKVVLA